MRSTRLLRATIRPRPIPVVILFLVLVLVLVGGLLPALASTPPAAAGLRAGPAPDVTYRPPLDRPIIDPFRAPTRPYGPGNRGLEYDTAPGDVVRAIGSGTVTFAGSVGGHRFVTVAHPDGLRSTSAFVATISVRFGQRVARGDPLGTTGERFHLGVRRGDRYIDPAGLFGARRRVVLVGPFVATRRIGARTP